MKRLAAILLAGLLLMGTFAQAQSIPQNQFITKDELMELTANTNSGQGLLATGTDTDVKLSLIWGSRGESIKYYKTYHDEETAPAGPLVWWVAGAEDADSLVLMTQEPLLGTRVFQESVHDQTFYGNPGTQQVYANHWGASALRQALYRAQPFTTAEQALRKRSTTTTYDVKNDADYTTVDFLYAPAGRAPYDEYITVGEVDQLRIFKSYWKGYFWLRSPYQYNNALALVAQPNRYVSESYVYTEITNAVTAAAKMDMTSVLFASAASGSRAGGQTIANDAPLALRLDGSQKNLGSAGVTGDQATAWAENAQGTRLMVQGDGFSYAMPITSNELATLTATAVGLSSFADCRVWLEKDMPDGGSLTWAVMAGTKELPTITPTPTPPPPPAPIPETGDSATPALWLGLMITGGLALILLKRKTA